MGVDRFGDEGEDTAGLLSAGQSLIGGFVAFPKKS
jgi:hypothetical protein